ncbi:DUF1996 domain-containing protein [Streptomyces sp. NBC_00576]|uniref:DUF1996 domain-containing protein n=1 Tax=Streptomyces sp. NBC_00576 TaxID=2903665 RepID=UPI002E80F199|nr:DUF1996 domain-containing protein [Streptomyces sp. NBC_00576]WUB69000.1 DUF1996 domain-containing protein [Streptomyces sp. NBC_00576]
MGRNTRRRPTGPRRATFAAVALMLGGGGLVVANVYASATEGGLNGDSAQQSRTDRTLSSGAATIDCPDVGGQLADVPDEARSEVDKELAALDQQIAEAYQRLQNSTQAMQQDSGFADSAIMNPLTEKRAATIERIAIAIDRVGDRPQGLEALATCAFRASGNQPEEGQDQNGDQNGDQADGGQDGQNQGDGQGDDQGGQEDQQDQQGGNGGQAGNGPVAGDFADITTVQPNVQNPSPENNASRGTFATSCGVNANGLFNSDNVIVAPGVSNGAHHFHDYVGNQANDAFASNEDLADAQTSCVDQGDKSSYFWPVLRLQNGTQEQDAGSPGGGIEGNAGEIVTPRQVTMTFVGNPRGQVVAMPKLLRIITGDAKAFVNGTANANASWSCTGFEDRQLTDKYPLCPQGSDVVRTFRFQSCWDGRNIDSANHRTHVAFADAAGNCAGGFQAIPQLVQRIVYGVDAPSLRDGGRTTPLFAVDSFPEQLHKPVTDHGDFINVFDENLMRELVDCINTGRQCGAGSSNGEDPGNTPAPTPDPPSGGTDEPTLDPTDTPTDTPSEDESPEPSYSPSLSPSPSTQTTDPGSAAASATPPKPVEAEPRAYTSPPATQRAEAAVSPTDGGDGEIGSAATADEGNGDDSAAQIEPQPEPQAVTGDLADTGTQLWPAGLGALLLIAGFLLLRRVRHGSR